MQKSLHFLIAALFLSLLPSIGYAEDYPKVIDAGKTWVYLYENGMSDDELSYKSLCYSFFGETLIDGKKYTKYCYQDDPLFSAPDDSRVNSYFREGNGKVYVRIPNQDGSYSGEMLLYDFTISVGDEYTVCEKQYYGSDIINPEIRVKLLEIDEVDINGERRRRYIYQCICEDRNSVRTEDMTFIEGLGPADMDFTAPISLFNPSSLSSSLPHLYIVYDNINDEVVYGCGGVEEPFTSGKDHLNILAGGLDFEYFKRFTNNDADSSSSADEVHYRVAGKTKAYGEDYYKVFRYKGTYDPDRKADLVTLMREEKGRLLSRKWIYAYSVNNTFLWRAVDDVNQSAGYTVCDFNEAPDEVAETALVNGELRKCIRRGDTVIVEGLGIVKNGVLPFPGDDYCKQKGYEYVLNCIRDAEGNVIFRRDQLSGIDDVLTGDEGAVETEYYDLTGRRVMNPEKGIYVVKDSAGVHKVVF